MEADLRKKLDSDLKQAMKSGDTVKRSVLRLLLSAIHNGDIARQATLSDTDILGVIAKEAKQREESIEAFKQGNRPDLATKEEAELVLLRQYLPRPMTRDEIVAEARRVIEEVGAKGLSDRGKVMSKLVAQLKGKADGREINTIVTELLH